MSTIRWALLLSLTSLLALTSSCAKEGCLAGDAACAVPSPCKKVQFTCATSALDIRTIASAADRPGGLDALGAAGDVVLTNGTVTAVIAGLGNQNFLDPNGGSILDLSNNGQGNDGLNQVLQVVGILPGDAVRYTELQLIDERPERVAVQVKGTLDGQPDKPIYTLYELRPCDRGLRARTELVNRSNNAHLWALMDGFYWSKREALPFTPSAGTGFSQPSFNLLTINDAFLRFPYMAASTHVAPHASYAEVSCTDPTIEGFNSDTVSAVGLKRTVVQPREYLVYERFLAVTPDDDVAGAASVALEVQRQVLGQKVVKVVGKVERPGATTLGSEREVSIVISAGTLADDAKKRTPYTQVTPGTTGTFSAELPAGKSYVVEVLSFGQKTVEREFANVSADTDLGSFVLPATALLTFQVTDAATTQGIDAEIFVVAADEAAREATKGSFHGQMTTCSPLLGPSIGGSPACNRILVRNGQATAEVPVGNFHFYAFHGPFWTLERKTLQLTPTAQTLSFALRKLALQPAGTVSADLHVHGASSFDSSLPDYDRVLSFAASDLQVIVATDHDVVYDYGQMVQQLGLSNKMSTVTGTETTGHMLFMKVPGGSIPLVIGHYNFWPLRYDPSLPRNGGPFDELVEPGALFDRLRDGNHYTGTPLIELNHPWADAEFGRDLGFPRALGLNLKKDLPDADDGTSAGMYVRTPTAGGHANNAHHAQEVMNGSQNDALLPYRAFWWYTLNQGQLKTGTANSDSHSLTDNIVGMPRNLVYAATQAGPTFDVNRFNEAVIAGKVMGTNGPVIEATVDNEGEEKSVGMTPFAPKAGAKLKLKVSAAPWVPVQELRFVVNGEVVKTLGASALSHPADPFGTTGLVRYEGEVGLAELLGGITGDAWLVVEAGRPLPLVGDIGGGSDGKPDGVPDTSDNNGDGVVDASDVGADRKTGPLKNPDLPKSDADPQFHYSNITDGYPFAFTNPFLLDRNGNGKFDRPTVTGGR